MNKLAKLVFAVPAIFAMSVHAQTNIKEATPQSAYAQDASSNIVYNSTGLCWRSGYWTPADTLLGCDGALVATTPAPATSPPAAAPVPTAEKVTFDADAFFDFDKTTLKPEGKTKLDELLSKQVDLNLEVIIAVGHTDSIGSDTYNQKLSIRRAEAVKFYLVGKGVDEKCVLTEGKGEKYPVATNKTAAGRAQNRRVEIEVIGTRK